MKVMTFNLRIDVPVDGVHQWRYRVPAVLDMIHHHQPDILLLQETTPAMLQDIQGLHEHYVSYYCGRNADKLGEGCPIYVKKSRYQIRFVDTIWLSQQPRTPGSMDPEEGFPRIASMVTLVEHQSNKLIRVINAHLAYRSARAKDMNLKVLFDYAQSFDDGITTIIGGDFNANLSFIKPYKPNLWMASLLPQHGPTIHDFKGGLGSEQIDHLFFQTPLSLVSVEIDRRQLKGIFPSDHYPVIGVYQDDQQPTH